MDEDIDDDDEMGLVEVCLQNLRMGQPRERTFPLVRHSGDAKAKFSGNIKLILETTTFGGSGVAGDALREEAVLKRLLPWFHTCSPTKMHLIDAMFAKRPGAPELVLQDAQELLGYEPGTASVNISAAKFQFEPCIRDGKIKKIKKRDVYLRLSMPNVLNKKAVETAVVKGALDRVEFSGSPSLGVRQEVWDALRVELMESVVGEDTKLGSAVISMQRLLAGVPRTGVYALVNDSGEILGYLTLSLCAQGFGLPAASDDDDAKSRAPRRRRRLQQAVQSLERKETGSNLSLIHI